MLGNITYESIAKQFEKLQTLWQKNPTAPIFCIINSGGGMIDAGFMFVDLIEMMKVNLVTIGTGGVRSMAIPMFCAGQHRVVTAHTDFFFHELGFQPNKDERLAVSEILDRGKNLDVSQGWYADFVSEKTGGKLTSRAVKRMMEKETYLMPDEIVKCGLAHEVI